MALNKKNRLKKKLDFEDVFKKGKAVKGSFLFIKYKKNSFGAPRFGFVVSAKVVGNAVERNKIRRILSEVARGVIGNLDNYDMIVLVASKITAVSRDDVVGDFLKTLKKI